MNQGYRVAGVYVMLVIIWSSTWMFMKISVGNTPFFAATLRFVIAAMALAFFQKVTRNPVLPERSHLNIYLIVGLGNYFVGYGLTYWAMPFIYSNIASLFWATFPVQVAVFAQFLLPNEKLNLPRILSLILAITGSILIFDVRSLDMGPRALEGLILVVFSIAGAACSNVLIKKHGQEVDAVRLNIYGMLIGGSLLFAISLIIEPWRSFPLDFTTVGATLYLAFLGSAVAFTAYFWLLKHMEVTKLSYITFLIPIFASILGWVFLQEILGGKIILGAVFILSGVLLPDLWRKVVNSHL